MEHLSALFNVPTVSLDFLKIAKRLKSMYYATNSLFQHLTKLTVLRFIRSQEQLELDAREALPYQFDTCTKPMGPLRQLLFSCLTCNPPPADPKEPFAAAGVCYSCSISCHGKHTLVELFNKRDFECDCGTSRLPADSPCTLRINMETGLKGGVAGETPRDGNKYNQNFGNRFCGCEEIYDAHTERGTMFQCLGLGTVEEGGCGEDWWHPECVVGLPRRWYEKEKKVIDANGESQRQSAGPGGDMTASADTLMADDDPPVPPGFPKEDEFEHFICYKCLEAFPWVKQYAGTPGFLPALSYRPSETIKSESNGVKANSPELLETSLTPSAQEMSMDSRKRKASPIANEEDGTEIKRQKSVSDALDQSQPSTTSSAPYHSTLPPREFGEISIFVKEDFREHFCRCPECFPRLAKHPQLLDEEENYEPPVSDSDNGAPGSVSGRSLLERGEVALSNMDRVRAIEGVMVYNHLKDKVKDFLKPFAESGKAVGAEDIKAYFEKLRGDAEALKQAASKPGGGDGGQGDGSGDNKREQSGF